MMSLNRRHNGIEEEPMTEGSRRARVADVGGVSQERPRQSARKTWPSLFRFVVK